MLDAGYLDTGYWMLDAGYLDAGCAQQLAKIYKILKSNLGNDKI